MSSDSENDQDAPSRWFDLERLLSDTGCRQVRFHAECESTNSIALSLAGGAADLPLLVLTDTQTAGRGRGSNSWWASDGALTFSLLIAPAEFGINRETFPLVSLTTALAVSETLGQFAPECSVGLKWPNDVHLNGRKVCGILVEPPPGRDDRLVIGIGLNVGNSLRAAPEELRSIATSIIDESGQSNSPHEVLEHLLGALAEQLTALGARQLNLVPRWQNQCILTGRDIVLQSGEQRFEGTCRGIEDSGAVVLESNGETRAHFAGTVRLKQDAAS